MDLVIYGTQGIALGTHNAIKTLHPQKKAKCFLVTSMENNVPILDGIPVRTLAEFIEGKTQEDKDNVEVLIGTPESVMEAIEKSLDEAGLRHYVRIDSVRWADMQKFAFAKDGLFMPLDAFLVGCHKPELRIYKMVHHKDKPLQTKFQNPDYMVSVQVGAAHTEERVVATVDNFGENISDKNGDFSELTGLYWVWKNVAKYAEDSSKSYMGINHYRRVFKLSEDEILKLQDNEIDIVLPYPMPYKPNIEAHHKRYLTDEEWSAVIQALAEITPEYAEAFRGILKQGYLYNYNIFIAKTKVLSDYCEWLFPILFRIERINDPYGTKEPNRFIGYVAESLETLYFMCNKQQLNIAHTGVEFLL